MATKSTDDYKEIIHEHYAEEAKKYQLSLSSTMHDLNVRRLEIENIIKYLEDGKDCLEVGCGNGAASVEISKIKKINLVGIDVTKEMIELAKQQPQEGIKGHLEFHHQDVIDFDQPNSFDIVFTIRCIINILNWDGQKRSLENMTRTLRPNGKLILLEAFSDGLQELNQARKELGLDPIPPAPHNLHLNKDLVKQHLSQHGMEFLVEDNFLSSYYFGTRVIYPALAKANKLDIVCNSKFDNYFSHFPSYGNFAHIKILVFNKR